MTQYEVGGTADLRVEFRIGDVLTSPSSVTLSVKAPDGTITTPAPQELELGVFGYGLLLTTPGLWKWRFLGAGVGSSSGSLRAHPGFGGVDLADYVPLGEITTALQRPLTSTEADRAQQLVRALVTTLETNLNRHLVGREIVGEKHVVGHDGRIYPFRNHTDSYTVTGIDDTPFTGSSLVLLGAHQQGYLFHHGAVVTIDYETEDNDAAANVVLDAIVATATAGAIASSGAIGSYSVEGTSITYAPAATGGSDTSVGRITVGSMNSISRLRVPVSG